MKRKLVVVLLSGLLLRLALAVRLPHGWPFAAALAWGVLSDLGLGLILSQPPCRFRAGWRWIGRGLLALLWFTFGVWQLFEYFYFEEFAVRPDQVVLDYVFYTAEVSGNAWESYPVGPLLATCALAACLLAAWTGRPPRVAPGPWRRLAIFLSGAALFAVSAAMGPPLTDRLLRELAMNGAATLAQAAWTGELDYASHYPTIPPSEALARVRAKLATDPGFGAYVGKGIRRRVDPPIERRHANVVLVISESLGLELTAFGRKPAFSEAVQPEPKESWTPEFDRLAREGMLFTRFFATGTRTARALEGALTSYPPIPGNAVVRHARQRRLDSLASVLASNDYRTVFLYGGSLGFDNMRSFLTSAGFAELVEDAGTEKGPVFRTAWGAADEHVFDRALAELRSSRLTGRPVLLVLLTTSNHRPFRFPPGRAPGNQGEREGVVRYADWALGRFFDEARREGLSETTLFALVGDHGPRSYLRDRMPVDAHRVPFLLWGPSFVPKEVRETVGSTLDVTPTLLGLLGLSYEASFFGRNLAASGGEGRALLQNKRDLGYLTANGLTLLGFHGSGEGIRSAGIGREGAAPQLLTDERTRDAVAFFQTAFELYRDRRLSGEPQK